MNYTIIRPPLALPPSKQLPRKQLKEYNQWFHQIMPERLQILSTAVHSTSGFENWVVDLSPESLDILGEWFFRVFETRTRSQAEIDEIVAAQRHPVGVAPVDLTEKTYSLAIDIGMYLAQTLKKNHPSLIWSQRFENKRHIDYGQPVLEGFSTPDPFNPIQTVGSLAFGFYWTSNTGKALRALYDFYAGKVFTFESFMEDWRRKKHGQP